MATLEDAIHEIAKDLRALPGIRDAPSEAPEQMNVFPFVAVYPGIGSWDSDIPGNKIGLHNITIDLHVARKDLARDIEAAMVYSDSIPNTLLKAIATEGGDKFNHTIETFQRITYTFGRLDWGESTQTIGFRFTMEGAKIQSSIT